MGYGQSDHDNEGGRGLKGECEEGGLKGVLVEKLTDQGGRCDLGWIDK